MTKCRRVLHDGLIYENQDSSNTAYPASELS